MIRFIVGLILLFVALPTVAVLARTAKRKLSQLREERDSIVEEPAGDSWGRGGRVDRRNDLSGKIRSYESSIDNLSMARTGVLVLGLLMVAWSLVRIVPANNVAIPTTFGKPGAPLEQGLHVQLPWTTLHSFSTRVQTSQRLTVSDEGDKDRNDCVETGAKDGADLCVDSTIRYTINKGKASDLYRKYGNFDQVNSTLIRRSTEDAFKVVYGRYSPEEAVGGSKVAKIRDELLAQMRQELKQYGIDVVSVSVGKVHVSKGVQDRINQLIQARKDAEKAVIDQQTALTNAETRQKEAVADAEAARIKAQGEADANAKLAESLTPELLQKLFYEALGQAGTVIVSDGGSTPPVILNGGASPSN